MGSIVAKPVSYTSADTTTIDPDYLQNTTTNTTQTGQANVNQSTLATTQETSSATTQGYVNTAGSRSTVTDTMDPATRAAYNQLLATLGGGGTAAQRAATATLQAEMTNASNMAASFSTQAAREQAQKSVALYNQQFQEGTLKTIQANAEAAGLSGDAFAALLSQQGAIQVARQAADAELEAIVNYGNLAANSRAQAITAGATLQDSPIVKELLAALEIGEGSYTSVNESWQQREDSYSFSQQQKYSIMQEQMNSITQQNTITAATQDVQKEDKTDEDEYSNLLGGNTTPNTGLGGVTNYFA